jgi:WD40 repeat protein
VRIWDVATRSAKTALKGHTDAIYGVAFSPDGASLASCGNDNNLFLWNLASGKSRSLMGHTGAVQCVAFSPDGQTLASGGADATIKWWNVASGECKSTLPGHEKLVKCLAYDKSGKLFASGDAGGSILLWNAEVGVKIAAAAGVHANTVYSVAFSPTQPLLASASFDRTIKLWQIES